MNRQPPTAGTSAHGQLPATVAQPRRARSLRSARLPSTMQNSHMRAPRHISHAALPVLVADRPRCVAKSHGSHQGHGKRVLLGAGAFATSFMRSSRSINEQGLERKQRADEPLLERYRSICPLVAASACTALSVCMGTWCALRLIVLRLPSARMHKAIRSNHGSATACLQRCGMGGAARLARL